MKNVNTISGNKFQELLQKFQPGEKKTEESSKEVFESKKLAKELIERFTAKRSSIKKRTIEELNIGKSEDIMNKVKFFLEKPKSDNILKFIKRTRNRKISLSSAESSDVSLDESLNDEIIPDQNLNLNFNIEES